MFQGVLGFVAVRRQNHGYGFAHVVYLVFSKGPVIGDLDVLSDRPAAGYADRPLVRQVIAGKCGYYAG